MSIKQPSEAQRLELATNSLRTEMRGIFARLQGGSIDAKRPTAWDNYGYKEDLAFNDFYRLWRRGSVAHGAVGRLIGKCWQDNPDVIQGTPDKKATKKSKWERDLEAFNAQYKLWDNLREADLRRCVGGYSALILQVADGKKWEDELTVSTKDKRLYRLIPAWAGQLKPSAYNDDQTSTDFGMPTMYAYTPNTVQEGDKNKRVVAVSIHPSRVILIGELDDLSMLEAPFNSFVNLEKIEGGSGESFLKNSSRQISINFDKEVDLEGIAKAHGIKMDKLQTVFDGITRNMNAGLDQSIITKGASVTPLVANVPPAREPFEVSLNSACAAFQIPAKILIGNQQGDMASSDDKRDWAERCQGRRTTEQANTVEKVITHLQRFGFIGKAVISVTWSDLTAATPAEKMQKAKDMATINKDNAVSGDITFTTEQIIETAGFEVVGTPEPLPEGNDEGESVDENGNPIDDTKVA